jgi:hypothetical protein
MPYWVASLARDGPANAASEKIRIAAVFHKIIEVRPEVLPESHNFLETNFEVPTISPVGPKSLNSGAGLSTPLTGLNPEEKAGVEVYLVKNL